jgi:hypothetical protein
MEPTDLVFDLCRHFVADHSYNLEPALSERILGYIRSRSLQNLCEISSSFDPASHDHNTLRVLLQIEAFFKKNSIFSQEKCAEEALRSFRESEKICGETNARLDELDWNNLPIKLLKMRRFITLCLGNFESFMDRIPYLCKATNGATASRSRRLSSYVNRVSLRPYATLRSHIYLETLGRYWGYVCKPKKKDFNRIELVPKNWKTHRTIACEPEGNCFLQLAFDMYCKQKLKSFASIDLSDQSRNQMLAKKASEDCSLATVDLKAASDRLSKNVVHLLFDDKWSRFFFDLRSPIGKLPDGSFVNYQKLSSMGNGFTFAIETLVFAAACWAVGSKEYSVYGDDIIIESERYNDLSELLAYLGFEVNIEKSHASGFYRESCGVHYYNGFSVTPLFIRRVSTRQDLCKILNDVLIHTPYEGHLWKYASRIIREYNLPFVPHNDNPMSGVYLHPFIAYRKKLISTRKKCGPWQPMFKALVQKSIIHRCFDSRSLFLWYLAKAMHPNVDYESSRYSLGTDKYRSKWVHYFPVVAGGPDQLYCWSEYMIRPERG